MNSQEQDLLGNEGQIPMQVASTGQSGGTTAGIIVINDYGDIKIDSILTLQTPPIVTSFIGRQSDLDYFAKKLKSQGIVVTVGKSGIGKSFLAAKLAELQCENHHFFWYSFAENHSIEGVIRGLAGFLKHQGKPKIWDSLEDERLKRISSMPCNERLADIFYELSGKEFLLCFDEFEIDSSAKEHEEFASQLLRVASAGKLKIIITARTTQRIRKFLVDHRLPFRPLQKFTRTDTQTFLEFKGFTLSTTAYDKFYEHTNGQMDVMSLLVRELQQAEDPEEYVEHLPAKPELRDYLLNEDNSLSSDEQEVMRAVATLAPSAGSAKLVADMVCEPNGLQKDVQSVLNNLATNDLLIENLQGEYSQIAIRQSFYYNRLTGQPRAELHRRAANSYEAKFKFLMRIEKIENFDVLWKAIVHHNSSAKKFGESDELSDTSKSSEQFSKTAELVAKYIWDLLNYGYSEDLKQILLFLPDDQLKTELQIEVGVAKGELYRRLGEFDDARKVLVATIKKAKTLQLTSVVVDCQIRALSNLGLTVFGDNPKQALKYFKEGFALASKHNLTNHAAELKLKIGQIQIDLGKSQAARKSIKSILEVDDAPDYLKVDAYLFLTELELQKRKIREANKYNQEALTLAKQIKDEFRQINALNDRLVILSYDGDWIAAERTFEEAINVATKAGSYYQRLQLIYNRGVLCIKRGDSQGALENLRKCVAQTAKFGLNDLQADALSSLAELFSQTGEFQQASLELAKAEILAKELGNKYILIEVYRTRAKLHLENGKKEAAQEAIDYSLSLAREIEDDLQIGMSLRVNGDIQLAKGEAFEELYNQSLVYLEGDIYESACTESHLGKALLNTEKSEQGKALLNKAIEKIESLRAVHAQEKTSAIPATS